MKTFLNFKPLLLAKIPLHNIASSSDKVVSSKSGEKYAQIKHCLRIKKDPPEMDFDVRRQQEMDFIIGGNIMDYRPEAT